VIPHEELIAKLQEELWNSRPSGMCPVCGKPIVERAKSALEQWEAFLEAGPGGEDWLRRTLGRVLQLANYILIMMATIGTLGVGLYVISLGYGLLLSTFAWWLSALGVLVVFLLIHDWFMRKRAK
jgi:hypothetical protein